jgi:hypothetical protein
MAVLGGIPFPISPKCIEEKKEINEPLVTSCPNPTSVTRRPHHGSAWGNPFSNISFSSQTFFFTFTYKKIRREGKEMNA